jgi:Flp pilus assembly protein TadD
VAPITRICKRLALIAALVAAAPAAAAQEASDIYWNAQRQELSGRNGDALKTYARLLASSPDSEAAANNLLYAAVREGSMPDAVAAVRATTKAQTATVDAPLLLYVDAFKRRKWSEAEASIKLLDAGQDFAFVTPMLRGWLNVAQARPSGFSPSSLQSNGLTAYYGDDQLIYFDLADGNLPQARLKLRNYRGYGEPHGQTLARLAMGPFAAAGDAEFAAALAQQIGLEPAAFNHPRITAEIGLSALFARLALALQEQKQPEKALYFARLATWSSPESDPAKLAFAQIAKAEQMPAKARAALAGIAPTSPFWMEAIGELNELAETPEEATVIARNAAKSRPDSAQLMLLLARSMERSGQVEQAVVVYRSLLDMKGGASGRSRAVYQLMLAAALDANNDWNGARGALEDAIKADPQNAQALNYLGYSLLERRIDVKRGFELVARAHELAPQSAAITDSLGWAHFLKGDVAAAIPLLERAVAAAIDDVAINEHLGDAYWAAGRKTEARFAWKAASLSADGKVAERLAAKIDLGWTNATAAP